MPLVFLAPFCRPSSDPSSIFSLLPYLFPSATFPCSPYSFPWSCLSVSLSPKGSSLALLTSQRGGVGLKLRALVPLLGTLLSLEPVPGVRTFRAHSSSIFPVPRPTPATAASAWEITDTESAAGSRILLTGDFLPLRAPWWDQGPSWGLGIQSGGKEGWAESSWLERERGRAEGKGEREENGEMEGGGKEEKFGRRKYRKDERTVRDREQAAEGGQMGKGAGGRVWKSGEGLFTSL